LRTSKSEEAFTSWQSAKDPSGQITQEFMVENGPKRMVTGALWTPKDPADNVLIAFGHGASGDRYQAPIPYMANKLGQLGYTSVSMDGPVHGLRQVGPGGREALRHELERQTVIDDMVSDWKIAIEAAERKSSIEADRFAYFGLSMGSIFGIPLLAERSQRKQTVTVATLGLLGTTGAVTNFSQRLKDDAGAINCPVLYLMQLEDELFPREGYLELFDSLGSPDKRLHANPGLHPEIPAEEINTAIDFLAKHLEGDVPRRIVNPLAE
jgi:alpha-beta hydrolase superfamily lysophospholipase